MSHLQDLQAQDSVVVLAVIDTDKIYERARVEDVGEQPHPRVRAHARPLRERRINDLASGERGLKLIASSTTDRE